MTSTCFSMTSAFNLSESSASRSGSTTLEDVMHGTIAHLEDNTGHNLNAFLACSVVFILIALVCASAAAVANRCLQATSTAGRASMRPCRFALAAKQSALAQGAL